MIIRMAVVAYDVLFSLHCMYIITHVCHVYSILNSVHNLFYLSNVKISQKLGLKRRHNTVVNHSHLPNSSSCLLSLF